MARLRLASSDVQEAVDRLVNLFFRAGSVNAMAEELSATGTRVYPNRLHTLLSDDPNVAINESTLTAVKAALDRLPPDANSERTSAAKDALHARAWSHLRHQPPGAPLEHRTIVEVAAELEVPPAVIRATLRAIPPAPAVDHGPVVKVPDWTFQDVAYHRCREALGKTPSRKVALIIPTGGGKTRVALRVLLGELHDARDERAVVLWVTHRKRLAAQARRELQAMMNAGTPELPEDAVKLLADRFRIIMVGQLADALIDPEHPPTLVVIDEAHHAAAPSYLPIFEAAPPVRGLFLTATPIRTDLKSIGIDEIGYTITYRELFERNVLMEPTFETYNAGGRRWLEEQTLNDFADYLLSHAEDQFTKTLVIASTVANVMTLHAALLQRLDDFTGHVLGPDDIAWVHGEGSVSGAPPDTFLDEFQVRPRGILIATSGLLGEGFDDPSINTVVVTYPSSSLINLMQAAGRCLRYYPSKTAAFVIQVVESELSYHFEQRWLYQDISDYLRPQLLDRDYEDATDLVAKISELLRERNVHPDIHSRVLARLAEVQPGDTCSLLLSGLPYDGDRERFLSDANWNAVLVTSSNREEFITIFNEFCSRETRVADPLRFLRSYMREDPSPGSDWLTMNAMLLGMQYARREILGEPYSGAEQRDFHPNRGTSWLTYVTFHYHPQVPAALREFLEPCVNRDDITTLFVADRNAWSLAVRLGLPLAGSLAWLLTHEQAAELKALRDDLITQLRLAPIADGFAIIAARLATLGPLPLPYIVLQNINSLLSEEGWANGSLDLGPLLTPPLSTAIGC